MTTQIHMTKELAARYAGRGAAKRCSGNAGKLCVEGDFVTITEIAKRLGLTNVQVQRRKHRVLRDHGKLTWELLQLEKPRAKVEPQLADAPTD